MSTSSKLSRASPVPRAVTNASPADASVQMPNRQRVTLVLDDLHRLVLESMHYVASTLRVRGLERVDVTYEEDSPVALEFEQTAPPRVTVATQPKVSMVEQRDNLRLDLTPLSTKHVVINHVSQSVRPLGSPDDDEDDEEDYAEAMAPPRRKELQPIASPDRPVRVYTFTHQCGFTCDMYYNHPGFFPMHPMMARSVNELELEAFVGPAVSVSLTDLGLVSQRQQRAIMFSPFNNVWRTVLTHCMLRALAPRFSIALLGLRVEYQSVADTSFAPERFMVSLHVTLRQTR